MSRGEGRGESVEGRGMGGEGGVEGNGMVNFLLQILY